MNKLDTKLQNSSSIPSVPHSDPATLPSVAGQRFEATHRLLVLVPDADLDYAAATRRVWELADELEARIQFISLYKDAARESSLRRQLVMMTAMVQDGNASAEAKVEFGNNWVNVVKSNLQTGDMIVCFAEQHTGLLYRPLSQILRSNLEAPIYILSGLYPQSPSRFNMLSLIALWTGLISIVSGSFLLQIRLVSLPRDWTQTILLIISVMAELWLIWVWNNFFS
ncbi:MAG TPA: hypothetical protein VN843_25530 [Anaerolineales bacterium]|nr:hypothetical protein [Anaerolineales bacterium]